jgi:predicted 2-oxoglutarate/Fe(II)-dependent dioxygenase YbiX
MAYQSIWFQTNLNPKVIDIIEEDLKDNFDPQLQDSRVGDGDYGTVDRDKRNAKNAWVPTTHWIAGFVWHYVMRANRENFLYDLTNIDGESLQYTVYGEGEYYGWHNDAGLATYYKPVSGQEIVATVEKLLQDFVNENCEKVRKLSFSLLLSDPDTYEGGNLQLLDEAGKSYIAPRQRGTIILFDSRNQHRVQKVKSGVRKSLVGWVCGNRWK